MATRNKKRAQGSKAINSKPALPEIEGSEIDKWAGRQYARKVEELAHVAAALLTATETRDADKLKEISRKHNGMLGRIARLAIAEIRQGEKNGMARWAAARTFGELYQNTSDYWQSFRSFKRRATGILQKPEAPPSEIHQFGREDRKAERFGIANVLFGTFSTDSQLMIDCMFACLTASNEQLAQVKMLLVKIPQEGGES